MNFSFCGVKIDSRQRKRLEKGKKSNQNLCFEIPNFQIFEFETKLEDFFNEFQAKFDLCGFEKLTQKNRFCKKID